ncbi:MAG: hypothetical protein A3G20_04480 [Acidobacteria bacterium RIFCSPLOWO2_12_FULL_59_11]|nr:MAG: hypothetical protein A3G20_04480 [Acidobacteria bacterium RIFCSPLOWO2_12_FULL_59_11]OFW20936.1 MAG: hypothetical protein A3H27_16610 [Acidobacteria bacterium RIFCSPLOWO2_02_FULL_59_13]
MPVSEAVGTSGMRCVRLALETARGRSNPFADVRGHDGEVLEHHGHAPGEEVGHDGAGALVGDVHHVDAGHLLHQLAAEVPGGAGAGGGSTERYLRSPSPIEPRLLLTIDPLG